MRLQIAILLIAFSAITARAGGLDSLEQFVRTVKSGRADFTQVVSAPARDGEAQRSKKSSGSFEFSRPNRFRFIYHKPFEQSIVADGKTLWLHDPDLNQVSARKQSDALASTPVALIAAASDLQALRADFVLADAPEQDGLQWVLATPKSKEQTLHSVRIGFQGNKLVALDIVDPFGQRSVLTFQAFEVNPVLPASLFEFKVPNGADVIRQ